MKTITKERILKALAKADRYYDSKPEPHVVMTMAQIGLKSLCADVLGEEATVSDREKLELAYHHFNDPEEVFKRIEHLNPMELDAASALKEAWLGSWQRLLEKLWARQDKILALQERHSISGLEEAEFDFQGVPFKFHKPASHLALIPSDYKVIKSEVASLVTSFITASQRPNVKMWRRFTFDDIDEWIPSTTEEVEMLMVFEWAKAWTHSGEVHLLIGIGTPDGDDESDCSVWFCCKLGDRKPSL